MNGNIYQYFVTPEVDVDILAKFEHVSVYCWGVFCFFVYLISGASRVLYFCDHTQSELQGKGMAPSTITYIQHKFSQSGLTNRSILRYTR